MKIAVLLGYGNGTFSEPILSLVDDNYINIQCITADFNNDRISDIAIINIDYQYIRILYGNGDGTFMVETEFFLESNFEIRRMSAADVNGDGYNDIVVTSTNIDGFVVCYGNADGTFVEITTSNRQTIYIPSSINTHDFNNDNFMDIALVNDHYNTIDVFLGYGNRSFQMKKTSSIGGFLRADYMTVGDFNEDQMLDVVVTQLEVSAVNVLFGYGDGSFGNKTKLILISDLYYSVAYLITLADVNKDGHLDVVICQGEPCVIIIFYGDGNGSFERHIMSSIKIFNSDSFISTGDLNGDGYPDIISSFNNTWGILFNNGQCS